jgi:hypothetical protein
MMQPTLKELSLRVEKLILNYENHEFLCSNFNFIIRCLDRAKCHCEAYDIEFINFCPGDFIIFY